MAPTRTSTAARTSSATPTSFGPALALSCRECGQRVELGPTYACESCFGPLEVAYEFGPVTRAQIEAGPQNIWRYAPLLPVSADVASRPNLNPGFTKLV